MGRKGIRSSLVGEWLLIVEAAQREGVSAATRRFDSCHSTVYALMGRYESGGLEGLLNQPRGCSLPVRPEVAEATWL